MGFFKKLFGKKEDVPVVGNEGFWNWFIQHEASFYATVKGRSDINKNFLDKLMPKLQDLNGQFYCVTGMCDEDTAELIITAEGDIKTFVFVEELVAEAPVLKNWKFTALKEAVDTDSINISMDEYEFNDKKIRFFSNEHASYPDEIDITLVHEDFNSQNEKIISNGTFIYLDNILGELNAATLIDNATIAGNASDDRDLIPIKKLSEFLLWREKEFVERYKGIRRDTENDEYAVLEGKDGDGKPLLAVINRELVEWDAKPSHPWMMLIKITYTADNDNGMPGKNTYTLMDQFEETVLKGLPDSEGYLNLGRETYNSSRTIFFACKEFRKSSKTVSACINDYLGRLDISYDIFRDKYWMTMNRFLQQP